MLDKVVSDCVCVCVCVYTMGLCWPTGSFGTSWDQVHGTCEQSHNNQIILRTCTGLCTVVKLFLKSV